MLRWKFHRFLGIDVEHDEVAMINSNGSITLPFCVNRDPADAIGEEFGSDVIVSAGRTDFIWFYPISDQRWAGMLLARRMPV